MSSSVPRINIVLFLSPSAEFAPGERTGKFRLGGDQLLFDTNGKSWISMEDFAIAMVDELEHPRHSRQRFTVGSLTFTENQYARPPIAAFPGLLQLLFTPTMPWSPPVPGGNVDFYSADCRDRVVGART